ncbi:DoxX family membrane protein [Sinomonas sp. P10A9]|uniref:DoxX family membrane protein n=1 Tax=Sinomonas puerhi TaxID=3238584 RepID=A0AB39L7Y7_9MICC
MGFKLSHAVLRLVTGAYMVNAGVGKLSLDEEGAGNLQGMAANALPQIRQIPPATFGKVLAGAEIGLGAALLAPFVPTKLAALALTAFSGGLLATYLKTPGLTQPDGIRPTAAGVPMAKDSWLVAIGIALLVDRKHRKPAKESKHKAVATQPGR